jgi:hypothetical protein
MLIASCASGYVEAAHEGDDDWPGTAIIEHDAGQRHRRAHVWRLAS